MNAPESNLITNLRALPPAAWVLFVGMFLNKFGAFVVPFLALYLTHSGYTLANAGMAISAYGIGNLIASLVGGHLADNIGRRKTILLSLFMGAGMMLLLSQARSLSTIIVLVFLTGLAGEFYRPACSALLTDLVPSEQRVTAFAAYRMSFNSGWAFGPATAGFLAAKDFLWLFVGDAATSILFGLVALLALPRDRVVGTQQHSWGDAINVIRRDRRFHQILLASLAIGFVFMQMSSTFGVQVTRLGFSAATYGTLISLNGLIVVFCELPLTAITQRLPIRRVLAAGYLLVGGGFALNAVARTIPALTASVVIFTFGEMLAMPLAAAYVSNLAPTHLRGRYMGFHGLNWALALIVAPAIGMKMMTTQSTVLWLGCGLLGVLAATIISFDQNTLPVAE